MDRELHIIIIWEKARCYAQQVEKEIKKVFNIAWKCEYCWEQERASENYAAFYGEKLADIQYKVEHCGKGAFLVYIVEDKNPIYEIRDTTSGRRKVNVNLFDLKAVLRNMTGGGHRIHASDTKIEANTNSLSLFGKRIENVLIELSKERDAEESQKKICRNISGVGGWKSWKEFFDILNCCTPYVVLRNYETILAQDNKEHGDTDLLVKDRDAAKAIIAGRKIFQGKERVLYAVNINRKEELVDLRYVGDNYYCMEWEKKIIKGRSLHESGIFYTADKSEEAYMLLYHALVHKPFLSRDYVNKLEKKFGETDTDKLKTALQDFMMQNQYKYTQPKDKSVFVHSDYFKYMQIPFYRKAYNKLKEMKYNGKNSEPENYKHNKCWQAVYKVLSNGYYLAVKILRKIKAGVRKLWNRKN